MESRPLVILEPPEPGFDWGERTDLNFQFEGPITRAKFREFLRNFRIANKYIYREALIRNWTRNNFSVEVDCAHLVEFDETLLHHLQVSCGYRVSSSPELIVQGPKRPQYSSHRSAPQKSFLSTSKAPKKLSSNYSQQRIRTPWARVAFPTSRSCSRASRRQSLCARSLRSMSTP